MARIVVVMLRRKRTHRVPGVGHCEEDVDGDRDPQGDGAVRTGEPGRACRRPCEHRGEHRDHRRDDEPERVVGEQPAGDVIQERLEGPAVVDAVLEVGAAVLARPFDEVAHEDRVDVLDAQLVADDRRDGDDHERHEREVADRRRHPRGHRPAGQAGPGGGQAAAPPAAVGLPGLVRHAPILASTGGGKGLPLGGVAAVGGATPPVPSLRCSPSCDVRPSPPPSPRAPRPASRSEPRCAWPCASRVARSAPPRLAPCCASAGAWKWALTRTARASGPACCPPA